MVGQDFSLKEAISTDFAELNSSMLIISTFDELGKSSPTESIVWGARGGWRWSKPSVELKLALIGDF